MLIFVIMILDDIFEHRFVVKPMKQYWSFDILSTANAYYLFVKGYNDKLKWTWIFFSTADAYLCNNYTRLAPQMVIFVVKLMKNYWRCNILSPADAYHLFVKGWNNKWKSRWIFFRITNPYLCKNDTGLYIFWHRKCLSLLQN